MHTTTFSDTEITNTFGNYIRKRGCFCKKGNEILEKEVIIQNEMKQKGHLA